MDILSEDDNFNLVLKNSFELNSFQDYAKFYANNDELDSLKIFHCNIRSYAKKVMNLWFILILFSRIWI